MKTKPFPLRQVLSITSGRLVCDMDDVYEILNFITGDNLYTHVLPRAARFAGPLIKEQYPDLAIAETEQNLARLTDLVAGAKVLGESAMVGCQRWLDWLVTAGLKREYEISSHADAWLKMDPIQEAESLVGKEKVIIV